MPKQIENGKSVTTAGEQVTVTDSWSGQSRIKISGVIIVAFDNKHEAGSILAGEESGSENATKDLYPAPVYLTYGSSQTWTLAAAWPGPATSCTVVDVVAVPDIVPAEIGSL